MKKHSPKENIEIPVNVNQEADKLEDDPEAMLRLIDYIFFLDDREDIPS